MTEEEEGRELTRRDEDRLVKYRLDKLETIVEKLVENQQLLTKVEIQSQETMRMIVALSERVSRHGDLLDKWMGEIATIQTKVKSQEEILEKNPLGKLANTVSTHSTIIGAVSSIVLILLAGKFFALI